MSKLAKKCFITATGAHLLLLLVLIFGPAFLVSRPKTPPDKKSTEEMTLVPYNQITDAMTSGGGNPEVEVARAPAASSAPQAQPVLPKPALPSTPPAEVKKPEPLPVKQPVVEPPPVAKSDQPSDFVLPKPDKKKAPQKEPKKADTTKESKAKTPAKKPEIVVNLKEVTREKRDELRDAVRRQQQQAEAERQEQARMAARAAAQRGKQLDEALSSLNRGLTGGMSVEMPGPGGSAFVNYADLIISTYQDAWMKPNDARSDETIVKTVITIARDGTIISARIVGRSGDEKVDRSVERVLRDVKQVAPFPQGATEAQRIFNIEFNLKAKRQIG